MRGTSFMPLTSSVYKKELLRAINHLPDEKLQQILDFTYFLKSKDMIDADQRYFWTSLWQNIERTVDEDKKEGKIIGDGTATNLLEELNRYSG